ncbi:extensin family protein [Hyphomicrobium sp. 99]|uniref:extensin-like domain-containing protein n=1 Tax=Hyphomicrobium sp. 99 TaxID=1163419 RepID=UPI000696B3BC|nr:extensin family protein [Hyphomicrobium sp. 99]
MALRSKAVARAHSLAVRYSVILTRAVFLGLLLLPLLEPNSFYIIRAGRVTSPSETELRARSEVGAVAPEVAPVITAEADRPPSATEDEPPPAKTADSKVPTLPLVDMPAPLLPAQPADTNAEPGAPDAKPLPPSKQAALPWTDAEIADAKAECSRLLANVPVITEELPPAREGICGAPAPRELRSVGASESKVKLDPPATLNCTMIAGLATWITDKLQPAAKQSFGSPIVRVIAESYSCRNRYGLSRAPLSEHALMDAVDVTGFVLADGKVIRISRGWGPTTAQLKRAAEKANETPTVSKVKGGKFLVSASKLGANDVAKHGDEKPKSEEAEKEAAAKLALSSFLHQAHDDACEIFGTVLGPDTNDAHHDHFHLDMKARQQKRSLCQ